MSIAGCVIRSINNGVWAILPETLAEMERLLSAGVADEWLCTAEDFTAADADLSMAALAGTPRGEGSPYATVDGVAIIPVVGLLLKMESWLLRLFGGTGFDRVSEAFRRAMADPDVSAILLYIDSPGGSIAGTQELASEIAAARGQKPILAFTDGTAASAAYWIASAADCVFISGDTTRVGSIGVVTAHTDASGYDAQIGERVTVLSAGKYKAIAHEHAPLTTAGAGYLQSQLDYLYSVFLRDVSGFRASLPLWPAAESATNPAPWAEGKVFTGRRAIDAGLADGVRTLDEIITEYGKGRRPETTSARGTSTNDRLSTIRLTVENELRRRLDAISATRARIEADVRARLAAAEAVRKHLK